MSESVVGPVVSVLVAFRYRWRARPPWAGERSEPVLVSVLPAVSAPVSVFVLVLVSAPVPQWRLSLAPKLVSVPAPVLFAVQIRVPESARRPEPVGFLPVCRVCRLALLASGYGRRPSGLPAGQPAADISFCRLCAITHVLLWGRCARLLSSLVIYRLLSLAGSGFFSLPGGCSVPVAGVRIPGF